MTTALVLYFALCLGLGALASFRIAHLLAVEDGPFDAMLRWRTYLARSRDANGDATWVARGFNCVLCMSYWIALPVALYLVACPLFAPLGLWGAWWVSAGSTVLIWHALAALVLIFYKGVALGVYIR